MANRIEKAMTEAEVSEIRDLMSRLSALFKAHCITLTGTERNLLPSARNNYEKYMMLLLQIAEDYKISLPQFSPEAIAVDLKMQADMSLMVDHMGSLYTMAIDSYRAARAEGWKAFLGLYNVLNVLSAQDAELKGRMKAIVDFMAHGSRRQSAEAKDSDATDASKGDDASGIEGDGRAN